MKKQVGFTLIEFVMVIVIISIVAAFASKIIVTGLNSFLNGQNILAADWQIRIAMERMSRDIHSVRSSNDISTASSNQLVFTNNAGTSVTYALSGSTLTRNSIVLADGISGLSFSYFDQNGNSTATLTGIQYVTFTLTNTGNNANFSATSSIELRNS